MKQALQLLTYKTHDQQRLHEAIAALQERHSELVDMLEHQEMSPSQTRNAMLVLGRLNLDSIALKDALRVLCYRSVRRDKAISSTAAMTLAHLVLRSSEGEIPPILDADWEILSACLATTLEDLSFSSQEGIVGHLLSAPLPQGRAFRLPRLSIFHCPGCRFPGTGPLFASFLDHLAVHHRIFPERFAYYCGVKIRTLNRYKTQTKLNANLLLVLASLFQDSFYLRGDGKVYTAT